MNVSRILTFLSFFPPTASHWKRPPKVYVRLKQPRINDVRRVMDFMQGLSLVLWTSCTSKIGNRFDKMRKWRLTGKLWLMSPVYWMILYLISSVAFLTTIMKKDVASECHISSLYFLVVVVTIMQLTLCQ